MWHAIKLSPKTQCYRDKKTPKPNPNNLTNHQWLKFAICLWHMYSASHVWFCQPFSGALCGTVEECSVLHKRISFLFSQRFLKEEGRTWRTSRASCFPLLYNEEKSTGVQKPFPKSLIFWNVTVGLSGEYHTSTNTVCKINLIKRSISDGWDILNWKKKKNLTFYN